MEIVSPESVGVSSERLGLIDKKFKKYCEDGKTAGIVTLAARYGKVFHHDVWGMQNLESNTPMALDSIFRIYSMTKPIVSVALMQLHEEGRFHLNDPISQFAPMFTDLEVLNSDGSVEKAEPVTFWHLLTHTSGMSYGFRDDHPLEKMYRDADLFERELTLEGMMQRIAKLPLRFQPGFDWHYSVSTDVVGYLVQVISGQPLGDYLQENIIQPLGMVDTSYEIPDEKLPRLTSLYGSLQPEDPYMKLLDPPETSFHRPPVLNQRGGSGLLSTAADYIKFAQMVADGGTYEGKRYLGRKTIELMTSNHLPLRMLPLAVTNEFPGVGFGLGFHNIVNVADTQMQGSVGNHGWSGAADTNFWIDPVEKLIGMSFMQYLPSRTIAARDDFSNFLYQALE